MNLTDLPVEDAWSPFLASSHSICRGLLNWELDGWALSDLELWLLALLDRHVRGDAFEFFDVSEVEADQSLQLTVDDGVNGQHEDILHRICDEVRS